MLAGASLFPRGAVCAIACLLAVTDCDTRGGQTTPMVPSSIEARTTPVGDRALTLSIDNAPSTLDPQLSGDSATPHVLDDLFEGLVALGVDGKPVAGVASDWGTSDDGKTWTFHLRPQARWSNGAPVTAQNFVFAWRREVDPKTGAAFAAAMSPLVNADEISAGKMPATALGVEAPDPRTVVVHLTNPLPYLLELLDQPYFYPLYEPAVAQWGEQWSRPEHIVSNGAFQVQEDIIGTRVTLTKNPYYWDTGNVRLNRVTYLGLDATLQSLRFQSGDVQFAYNFPSSQYEWLKTHVGDQAITAPYLGTLMIQFNAELPPFKDNSALRRALNMAIDRQSLVRYIKQGLNQAAFDLIPPLRGYSQAAPQWSTWPDAERYAEARRLYAQAGYSKQHPLRLELSIPNQGADSRRPFEAVADMWYRQLGAEVAIDQRELKVLIQEQQLHKLPLSQLAWLGDYPDPLAFLDLFRTQSEGNFSQYSNARFDALLKSAAETVEPDARYRKLSEAEAVLTEDSAMIPLFYYGSRHLVKAYVQGWRSNLVDRHPSKYMYIVDQPTH